MKLVANLSLRLARSQTGCLGDCDLAGDVSVLRGESLRNGYKSVEVSVLMARSQTGCYTDCDLAGDISVLLLELENSSKWEKSRSRFELCFVNPCKESQFKLYVSTTAMLILVLLTADLL